MAQLLQFLLFSPPFVFLQFTFCILQCSKYDLVKKSAPSPYAKSEKIDGTFAHHGHHGLYSSCHKQADAVYCIYCAVLYVIVVYLTVL